MGNEPNLTNNNISNSVINTGTAGRISNKVTIGGNSINSRKELSGAISELRTSLNDVAPDKQVDAQAAIEILETAVIDQSISKVQIAQAAETLSQIPSMRQKLESIIFNVATGLASGALIEGIKFAIG